MILFKVTGLFPRNNKSKNGVVKQRWGRRGASLPRTLEPDNPRTERGAFESIRYQSMTEIEQTEIKTGIKVRKETIKELVFLLCVCLFVFDKFVI